MAGGATMTSPGHRRQTYLYGPTLHVRAVERDDVASEPSWRNYWFPRALAVSEANIEDELGSDSLLVAVRNCDGVILGSVAIESEGAWRQARPFVARWLDPARADAVEAEIAELILPFLVDEGGAMTALIEIASGKPLVESALTRIGARRCYRHREAWLIDGTRRDKLGYQLFGQRAGETFGEPEIAPEESTTPAPRVPAPKCWPRIATPPAGTVMASERLYLRPFIPEDSMTARDAVLEETEFSHEPRFPVGSMEIRKTVRRAAEAALPPELVFAIVQREDDRLVGRTKLKNLDLVHRCAETGTRLYRPEYRGMGYGTEAKHLILGYAFEVLNLHMLWSQAWDINPRSRAAVRKQGYRLAGSSVWRQMRHGWPSSDWTFDLLAAEWQEARR
jgi:ribosomal-protein-alanine N-acetyltransferase